MSEIGDDKDIYDVYEQEKEMAHSPISSATSSNTKSLCLKGY